MSKLILGWVCACTLCIVFSISTYAQNNVLWRGFVSYSNGGIEPDETVCDYIKDGQLRIAPNLSEQAIFTSNLWYQDTICLSSNFSYEIRIKNNATIGGIADFENSINLYSNGLRINLTLAGALSSQANTQIKFGDSLLISNKPFLVVNPNDWHIVKMRFINKALQLFIDGVEVHKSNYSQRVCNIDIMRFAMKGAGAIDWIKVYDNNESVIWQEDFMDCKNVTKGIICDPFRLDKSVTISRPCENDTLTLMANFPAMSYLWSAPEGKKDTNKVFKIVKPTSGNYDLKANVNACFEFSKAFNVSIVPSTVVNKNIRLCLGQTHELPSKKTVNTEGVYRDTLKTKSGCDSIIITNVSFDSPSITNMNVSLCGSFYTLPSGRIVRGAGIYRDTTKDVNGCFQFYDVKLDINTPYSTLIALTLCEGTPYRLPKGQIVTASGIYRDTLKSVGGCDSIIINELSYTKKPVVKLSASTNTELFEGDEIVLIATSDNGTYRWFENGAIFNSTGSSANIKIKGGDNIYKVVLNNRGCESSDSLKIIGLSEIKIPNAFTPNFDGQNDNFSIVSKNENLYKIIQFDVYNRMGKKVYANSNGTKGWDGAYQNQDLVSDNYAYIIVVQSPAGRTFKFVGEVLLLR